MNEAQEKAIAYNQAFKERCKDFSLTDDDQMTKENFIKAASEIVNIYNYKIRFAKPVKKTILKYVPLKFLKKLMQMGMVVPWDEDFFVEKEKLLDFIEYLKKEID